MRSEGVGDDGDKKKKKRVDFGFLLALHFSPFLFDKRGIEGLRGGSGKIFRH